MKARGGVVLGRGVAPECLATAGSIVVARSIAFERLEAARGIGRTGVLAVSALKPKAELLAPVVLLMSASSPKAELNTPVLLTSAPVPHAVLAVASLVAQGGCPATPGPLPNNSPRPIIASASFGPRFMMFSINVAMVCAAVR